MKPEAKKRMNETFNECYTPKLEIEGDQIQAHIQGEN